MSEVGDKVLDQLPVFPDVTAEGEWEGLRIDGLVSKPLTLGRNDLVRLVQGELTDDFRCVEGWVVPGQQWEGVPVSTLLNLADPIDEAEYVVFAAGVYTVGLTLAEALDTGVIVALRLNGEWLPPEHGGPARLIARGRQCHSSVKWLDRIQLLAVPPQETGLEIAKARNARRLAA